MADFGLSHGHANCCKVEKTTQNSDGTLKRVFVSAGFLGAHLSDSSQSERQAIGHIQDRSINSPAPSLLALQQILFTLDPALCCSLFGEAGRVGGEHLPGRTICLGTRAREEEGKGKGRKEEIQDTQGLETQRMDAQRVTDRDLRKKGKSKI